MYTITYQKTEHGIPNVMKVQADCLERAIWIVKHLGYIVITGA